MLTKTSVSDERASAPKLASVSTGIRLERLAFYLALGIGLIFLVWLRLYQPPNTVDDAYITFRYARNIAAGVGFVYNAGDHVLGTTTPAYAMLLAALSRLSGLGDFPRLAWLANTLLDALTFCLIVRLGARLTGQPWLGLAAAGLFAVDGRTLDFSTGGMETSFNVMAVVLTLTLFFEGRSRLAALALGLAVLVRPDGAMLAIALFAAWGLPVLTRPRRWPWAEAGLTAAVLAPWVIFATLYFGHPVPQSILAKSELYRTPELMAFRAFLVQLRAIFPFSLPPLNDPEPLARQLVQVILPLGLAVAGLAVLHRRHRQAWVIGAYIALFIAFYTAGNPLWLGWYEVPLMPLYWLLILAAVAWIGERAAGALPGSPLPALRGALIGGAVLVMALPHLSRLNALPWETPQRDRFVLNPAFNKRREEDYELLARMLAPAARNDRLVAIPEIGAFGYVYPGDLFDTSGLISPPVLKYFPIPAHIPVEIYSVPREMIFDLQPDLFVTFDSFIQATLPPDDPEFLALYRPTIGLTSHAAFGIQRLMVYRRADLPVEAALPPAAEPAGVSFGADSLLLAGYSVRPAEDQDSPYVEVALFWQGTEATAGRDLLVRVNLWSADGQLAYQILDQPGEKLFPTPSWPPGMWLVDRYLLKRPTPEAGPYRVGVTVFAADADDALPARGPDGAALPEATFEILDIRVD